MKECFRNIINSVMQDNIFTKKKNEIRAKWILEYDH